MGEMRLTNEKIISIGALGGVILVLLKLIEERFYVSEPLGTTAITAYLTYVAYIIMGAVAAYIFVEKVESYDKTKKNAFVMGLLAPSVFLAIAQEPINNNQNPADADKSVPDIGAVLMPSAWASEHAQTNTEGSEGEDDPEHAQTNTEGSEGEIIAELITRQQLEPEFFEALKEAIGRGAVMKKYSFVLGKTSNERKAQDFATLVNTAVLAAEEQLTARVIRPEGKETFYVTVSEPSSQNDIVNIREDSESAAIEVLTDPSSSAQKRKIAVQILTGRIVETLSLFR